MAKKKAKKLNVELENIELKPQVIGYIYQKKSNVGRVLFIFVCFILAVYYINDISVFINNLLGRQTAETIEGNVAERPNHTPNQGESKDIVYNVFSNELVISESGLVINNFKYENNKLSFDANNNTSENIDLKDKKFFIEIYTQEKTLLDRRKVDFNSIMAENKVTFSFDINTPFYYIVLIEKTVEDYPALPYPTTSNNLTFTCTKGNEELVYTFINEELTSVKHTITDQNVNDQDYFYRFTNAQNNVNSYNNINGVNASFNSTLDGYSAVIAIDYALADSNKITDKYYFKYHEMARVVNFEMQTYGFTCK